MQSSDRNVKRPWRNRQFHSVGMLAILALSACASPATQTSMPEPLALGAAGAPADAFRDLRQAFRASYGNAVTQHQVQMRAAYPIVTQDFLQMTLHLSGGRAEKFALDQRIYSLMAHTSHPPLTVYSILAAYQFALLPDSAKKALADFHTTLLQAALSVDTMDLDPATKERVIKVLSATTVYVGEILQEGESTEKEFAAFMLPLRPLIKANLYLGAKEQLDQFQAQMLLWKETFPHENWADLRVVVLGFHQARDLYALRLFFQWLLREPGYQNHVVYAEFQHSPFGKGRTAADSLAMILLTKVDFDHGAAAQMFGDSTFLQKDVMGPAAVTILQGWGESDWP